MPFNNWLLMRNYLSDFDRRTAFPHKRPLGSFLWGSIWSYQFAQNWRVFVSCIFDDIIYIQYFNSGLQKDDIQEGFNQIQVEWNPCRKLSQPDNYWKDDILHCNLCVCVYFAQIHWSKSWFKLNTLRKEFCFISLILLTNLKTLFAHWLKGGGKENMLLSLIVSPSDLSPSMIFYLGLRANALPPTPHNLYHMIGLNSQA